MKVIEFWQSAIDHLNNANTNRNNPFRRVVLSTISKDGGINQRTVIHREFTDSCKSYIYTDSSSAKILDLNNCPKASLLFYDTSAKLQISTQVHPRIISEGAMYEKHKEQIHDESLIDYMSSPSTGTVIGEPFAYKKGPDLRFVLLEFTWMSADVLRLSRSGHKRAKMTLQDNLWTGNWLVP